MNMKFEMKTEISRHSDRIKDPAERRLNIASFEINVYSFPVQSETFLLSSFGMGGGIPFNL